MKFEKCKVFLTIIFGENFNFRTSFFLTFNNKILNSTQQKKLLYLVNNNHSFNLTIFVKPEKNLVGTRHLNKLLIL